MLKILSGIIKTDLSKEEKEKFSKLSGTLSRLETKAVNMNRVHITTTGYAKTDEKLGYTSQDILAHGNLENFSAWRFKPEFNQILDAFAKKEVSLEEISAACKQLNTYIEKLRSAVTDIECQRSIVEKAKLVDSYYEELMINNPYVEKPLVTSQKVPQHTI